MANAISDVEDDSSNTSRSIQGKYSLDGDVHGRRVEKLEHNLSHFFTVGFWVKRSLSEEDRVFLRGNTEFVVEGVVPDFLHVVPVCDYAMFDGVSARQHAP